MIITCSPIGALASAAYELSENENDDDLVSNLDNDLDELDNYNYYLKLDNNNNNNNTVKVIQIENNHLKNNEDIGFSLCISLGILSLILFFIFIAFM